MDDIITKSLNSLNEAIKAHNAEVQKEWDLSEKDLNWYFDQYNVNNDEIILKFNYNGCRLY